MGVSFTHVGFESLIDFADSLHYINCVTQENVPTSINSLNEDYFESLKSIINLDNKNTFLDDNEKGVSWWYIMFCFLCSQSSYRDICWALLFSFICKSSMVSGSMTSVLLPKIFLTKVKTKNVAALVGKARMTVVPIPRKRNLEPSSFRPSCIKRLVICATMW